MKLPFAAVIIAFASAAMVAAAATAVSYSSTPTRRLEGYGQTLPFWSPRPRRRELSPAGKRGDPSSASDLSLPALSNIWEVVETPLSIQLDGSFTAFGSLTDQSFATSPPLPQGPTATADSGSLPSGLPSSASDLAWEDTASHGCRLVDAMRVSDHDAGQLYSPFRTSVQSTLMNFDDFTGWGWNAKEDNGENFTDFDGGQKQPVSGWGIGKALRELGVSDKIKTQGGRNVIIDVVHGKEPFTNGYTKNGKTYPVRVEQHSVIGRLLAYSLMMYC
jgi:hypothetical protein